MREMREMRERDVTESRDGGAASNAAVEDGQALHVARRSDCGGNRGAAQRGATQQPWRDRDSSGAVAVARPESSSLPRDTL